MNIIPCTSWVRRGVAAEVPEKVVLTPQELQKIIKQTQSELRDEDDDSENEQHDDASTKKEKDEDQMLVEDQYNFDKYDEESGSIHCNIGNIISLGKDGKDPLLTGDDNDSEEEDDIIKPDDNLVLIGHVEGDASILEVFVYNEAEGSFYCHHDILLPSFPLCIEWLNFDPTDSKPSNLCAIGNMTPIIEVWDLDIVDCLEPAYKLGCKSSKKKKRVSHKDAVLDLAWNENYIHVLASGSVDQTVLLWDLENGKPVNKFSSFNEKVQSLQWHPTEAHHLLTGCADKLVRLFDCKYEKMTHSWEIQGEVEKVLWNQYNTNYCLASTENGYMNYIDIRQNKMVWQIQAHEKDVIGLSLSSSCPGLLVTASNDSVVKVWDIADNTSPVLVYEKETNLGALQCLAPNPDNPFVFAIGGNNKQHNFKVLDLKEIAEVREKFQERGLVKPAAKQEEMMDVTENMGSMILNSNTCKKTNKKKGNK